MLQWLLRIFFAATIGFEIPIRDFFSAQVLGGRHASARGEGRTRGRVGWWSRWMVAAADCGLRMPWSSSVRGMITPRSAPSDCRHRAAPTAAGEALLLFVAVLGKVATGFWVMPLRASEFFKARHHSERGLLSSVCLQ